MKYNCKPCNYSTECRVLWHKHKNTIKHKKLGENNKDNNDTEILKKDHEIELLKEKLKTAEIQLKMKEEQLKSNKEQYENHIESLKMENNFQKQLISSAGGIIQKSVNTLSFLLTNYNEAPCLKSLNDYSIISKNMDNLVKDLIYYYKKNKLDKYFGDFLVKQYKKEKPELQALWSSDTDRLNYFIKELINNNGSELELKKEDKKTDAQWIVDRKGLKMTKYIINPLLEYVSKINVNYLNEKYKDNDNDDLDLNDKESIIKDMEVIALINSDIKNHVLSKNINKYIAPYFYLDKNKVKAVKNNKINK